MPKANPRCPCLLRKQPRLPTQPRRRKHPGLSRERKQPCRCQVRLPLATSTPKATGTPKTTPPPKATVPPTQAPKATGTPKPCQPGVLRQPQCLKNRIQPHQPKVRRFQVRPESASPSLPRRLRKQSQPPLVYYYDNLILDSLLIIAGCDPVLKWFVVFGSRTFVSTTDLPSLVDCLGLISLRYMNDTWAYFSCPRLPCLCWATAWV